VSSGFGGLSINKFGIKGTLTSMGVPERKPEKNSEYVSNRKLNFYMTSHPSSINNTLALHRFLYQNDYLEAPQD
jgi:hypothetical protein